MFPRTMRVLETERLALRWFDAGDAPFILELVNDPSWIANISDSGVRTLEGAQAWIAAKLVASYWDRGHGLWAVERRSDGALLGMCGLLERDSLPGIDVGYAFLPRFRGNGYAREATSACLRYGRDVLGKSRILAIVFPGNERSIRVLEAVGMTAEGTRVLAGDERPSAVFRWEGGATDAQTTSDGSARQAIDALVGRFFAAFTNRGRLPAIAAVPSLFTPGAAVTIVAPEAPGGIVVSNVRDFLGPRAALLLEGGLTDFEEDEVESRTELVGKLAQRSSRYRKAGRRDGVPFEGTGTKIFQLVETARGWKIAALAWEEAEKG